MSDVLRVAVPVPLPRLFDYLPAAGEAVDDGWVGCRVRVAFGRRQFVGLVVETGPTGSEPGSLKAIDERIDAAPVATAEWLATLRWASAYYVHPLGQAIETALPSTLRVREKPRARKRAAPKSAESLARPTLNDEQRVAVDAVSAAFGGFEAFVLEGVTGSGKTEVYLALIEQALAAGQQSLVLVPEIGLTPQLVGRFRERLDVPVTVLHSGLAAGARAEGWLAAARGEARVIVGTRSAVFTPLPSAGLVIIDEEHDASYKQQDGFRYSARDLAIVRARTLGVPIVLGSATPSLETLHNVAQSRYRGLRLSKRAGEARTPSVDIVDLRRTRLDDGLSPALLAAIGTRVAANEHVLVFRNRRGYSPRLLCHACGWCAECSRCEVAMTVHRSERQVRCHHCGRVEALPRKCPACGESDLVPLGVGTERLEESLAARFPDVPVIRIDRDTTRRKDSFEALIASLDPDRAAILVGTQMLAKGHDLPNLTLAALVNIDDGLYSADFRGPERLAQLIIQVAGRAGRGAKRGQVLLQTHHPEHALLRRLLDGGYRAFADDALGERAVLGFPPFVHAALLRAEAKERAVVDAFLAKAAELARTIAVRNRVDAESLLLRGPMPAPMPVRAGFDRGHLLLESPKRAALHAVLADFSDALRALPLARKVRWSLDVDPIAYD